MRIGIRAVHRVAHEREGGSRLDRALEHQAHDVLHRHGALLDPRVVHAREVAALPLLAPEILQAIPPVLLDVMRAHEMPGRIEVLFRQAPEQVGIADRGKDIVRLHAVVTVVGPQLQELGQVAMPCVEVDRHGALPHAELVDGDGGVVDDADPPNDAAGDPLESAYASACGADVSQVHAHAPAELAHLGEVVHAAVDALQAVGHGVDEAARQLMMRLTGVAHGGRRHRDLEPAQHVVEPADPFEADLGGLLQRKVQRDTEEHLLRALEGPMRAVADDIATKQQVEAGIGKQRIARRVDEGRRLGKLRIRVPLDDIGAVQPLPHQVVNLIHEALQASFLLFALKLGGEVRRKQARRHEFPARRLRGGELDRRARI